MTQFLSAVSDDTSTTEHRRRPRGPAHPRDSGSSGTSTAPVPRFLTPRLGARALRLALDAPHSSTGRAAFRAGGAVGQQVQGRFRTRLEAARPQRRGKTKVRTQHCTASALCASASTCAERCTGGGQAHRAQRRSARPWASVLLLRAVARGRRRAPRRGRSGHWGGAERAPIRLPLSALSLRVTQRSQD